MTHTTFTMSWGQAIGVRVIEDEKAYEPVEDWSRVRSPSRAARRRRRGYRQNIRIMHQPICLSIDGGRTLIIHPTLAAQLRAEVSARIDVSIRQQIAAQLGLLGA